MMRWSALLAPITALILCDDFARARLRRAIMHEFNNTAARLHHLTVRAELLFARFE